MGQGLAILAMLFLHLFCRKENMPYQPQIYIGADIYWTNTIALLLCTILRFDGTCVLLYKRIWSVPIITEYR